MGWRNVEAGIIGGVIAGWILMFGDMWTKVIANDQLRVSFFIILTLLLVILFIFCARRVK